MISGIVRGYRRARKELACVHATPDDGLFHTWRRRVKDHWYHVRLLEGLNGKAAMRVRNLKRLETWLGDDHNLVLLRATILKRPTRFGDEKGTAVVLGCLEKYQKQSPAASAETRRPRVRSETARLWPISQALAALTESERRDLDVRPDPGAF
jgi:hypothetical protein